MDSPKMANDAANVSIWRRHHAYKMQSIESETLTTDLIFPSLLAIFEGEPLFTDGFP